MFNDDDWNEPPNMPSNTTLRYFHDLPVLDRCKLTSELIFFKKFRNKSKGKRLPRLERVHKFVDAYKINHTSKFMMPMFPVWRRTVRDLFRDFEREILNGSFPNLDEERRHLLMEEIARTKEAIANAHQSPYYVATEDDVGAWIGL